MSAKRKITLILGQRFVNDPAIIIESIANSFPKDDITIKVNSDVPKDVLKEKRPKDFNLENKAFEATGEALEKANKTYEGSDKQPPATPEKVQSNKGRFNEFLKTLSVEGIKVSVNTLVKAFLEHLL